ncbi:MAG TPA: hypothetical protein VNE67_04150 [Acetobacteraceae bacterium]|nr:hypothetical protein [Acetobacteraceae bacterium]
MIVAIGAVNARRVTFGFRARHELRGRASPICLVNEPYPVTSGVGDRRNRAAQEMAGMADRTPGGAAQAGAA